MNPVMLCTKMIGVFDRLHSWMNWAPLAASSLKRMPLLAMIPTSKPCTLPHPQTSLSP